MSFGEFVWKLGEGLFWPSYWRPAFFWVPPLFAELPGCSHGLCPISERKPPDSAFPQKVQNALDDIFSSPRNPDDFQPLLTGSDSLPIIISDKVTKYKDRFIPDRLKIYWPSGDEVVLRHELHHLYQYYRGRLSDFTADADLCDPIFSKQRQWVQNAIKDYVSERQPLFVREIDTIRAENRFRACIGLPPRSCHGEWKIPGPLAPPEGFNTHGDCVLDPGEECEPLASNSPICALGPCLADNTCPVLQAPCSSLGAPFCGGGFCEVGQCYPNEAGECKCEVPCGSPTDNTCTGFCPSGMECDAIDCACKSFCHMLGVSECSQGACRSGTTCIQNGDMCICSICAILDRDGGNSANALPALSQAVGETQSPGSSPGPIMCTTCGNRLLEATEECDGELGTCPAGQHCASPFVFNECTCTGCGNSVLDPGEECEGDSSCGPKRYCERPAREGECTCKPNCGNGVIDIGEECDGISSICGSRELCGRPGEDGECTCKSTCGNWTLDPGEDCDGFLGECGYMKYCVGAGGGDDECTCKSTCGNGEIDSDEECDGDGSYCWGSAFYCEGPGQEGECTCKTSCGNSVLDPGEECEENNLGSCAPITYCNPPSDSSPCECNTYYMEGLLREPTIFSILCGDGSVNNLLLESGSVLISVWRYPNVIAHVGFHYRSYPPDYSMPDYVLSEDLPISVNGLTFQGQIQLWGSEVWEVSGTFDPNPYDPSISGTFVWTVLGPPTSTFIAQFGPEVGATQISLPSSAPTFKVPKPGVTVSAPASPPICWKGPLRVTKVEGEGRLRRGGTGKLALTLESSSNVPVKGVEGRIYILRKGHRAKHLLLRWKNQSVLVFKGEARQLKVPVKIPRRLIRDAYYFAVSARALSDSSKEENFAFSDAVTLR